MIALWTCGNGSRYHFDAESKLDKDIIMELHDQEDELQKVIRLPDAF